MLLTDAVGSEPHKTLWLPHPQRRILRLIRIALSVFHCQGPKANPAELLFAPSALQLFLVNTLAAISLGTRRVRNVLRLTRRKNFLVTTAIRPTSDPMHCENTSVGFTDAPRPKFEGHLYRRFLNILLFGQKKHVDVPPSFNLFFSRGPSLILYLYSSCAQPFSIGRIRSPLR